MTVSAKVASRITAQLKTYQGILAQAMKKDSSEGDTVVIVTDMISDILGYDKYQNLSSEHAIRGTYVDLMVSVDNKPRFLVEVKAVGTELKDNFIKQVVDYAANKGVDWVVLTNGIVWRVYKVVFAKPIDKVLVCELNALEANSKGPEAIECFGSLSLEGFSKDFYPTGFTRSKSRANLPLLHLSSVTRFSTRCACKSGGYHKSGWRSKICDLFCPMKLLSEN